MAEFTVTVDDEVENADVKLSMFARTLENGEAMVVPIPRGFPMNAMQEVAARVHFMLTQYIEVYAPKELTIAEMATEEFRKQGVGAEAQPSPEELPERFPPLRPMHQQAMMQKADGEGIT